MKKILSKSAGQTKKIGQAIVKKIFQLQSGEKALILALKGDLGGGKTTFLQGLAKGLGIKEKILSPTFVIIKKFPISNFQFSNFYHIDCYRIKKPKEILDLGFKEIISNPENIVAIEWADKIKKILPKNTSWIHFEFVSNNIRKIMLKWA